MKLGLESEKRERERERERGEGREREERGESEREERGERGELKKETGPPCRSGLTATAGSRSLFRRNDNLWHLDTFFFPERLKGRRGACGAAVL